MGMATGTQIQRFLLPTGLVCPASPFILVLTNLLDFFGGYDELLEDAQDYENTPQRSGPLDWTRQNVQERNQSNNRPSPSSNRPNTRGETNSNPVVAASSSSRPQGVPASQSRSFAQGDTVSPDIRERRGTSVYCV
jgi:hypothetical protein